MAEELFADPERPWKEYNRRVEDLEWDEYRARRDLIVNKTITREEHEELKKDFGLRHLALAVQRTAIEAVLEERKS
jgi:hypothetical protein